MKPSDASAASAPGIAPATGPALAPAAPSDIGRAMTRGMFVAAMFASVTGIVRVLQDAAIAWRHGTEPAVDAYYFMLSLVNWPVAVAMSTLTLLVAPAEAALRQGGAGSVTRWRAELLGLTLLAAVLALPPAAWALHTMASGGWSGLQPASAALAVAGVPWIVAAVPLGLTGALLAAWLVAAGRHALTLLEALPPLVLAVLLLASPGLVLFWGTAMGVAIQLVAMAWVLHLAGAFPRPRLAVQADAWRSFHRGAVVMLCGQTLFAMIPLVDPFFAARLGDGVVASLGYASRLVLGLQGLAGLAVQRAGLPLLSRWMAASPGQAHRAALRWAAAAGLAGVAIGLLVAALADPLVALLFERGRFTATDRAEVAQLLRYGMLQMPVFLAGVTLVTALAAAGAGPALAFAAGTGLVAKVALSATLAPALGARGLLIATALMYLTTTLMVWGALRRESRAVRG